MRPDTQTLADALDVLAREIESGDGVVVGPILVEPKIALGKFKEGPHRRCTGRGHGVANAVIAEAAQRLRELEKALDQAIRIGCLTRRTEEVGVDVALLGVGSWADEYCCFELAAYLRGKEESNG